MKSVQIALLMALLLPLATLADAKPNKSSSFKSGFSSQKSSSTRSGSGFGSFGSTRSAPPPRAPEPANASRSGGFGSFGGGAAAAPQQSDSALSQRLSKKASEDNALRTLDARRRAEQDAINANARPVPSGPMQAGDPYGGRNNGRDNDYSGNRMPAPAPIIIQQGNNGIGSMVTGFLLGKATSSARASSHGYPATAASTKAASGGGFFTAMLRTLAWLVILAIVGWTVYFVWKFLRRGKAPSTANYSFER